MFADSFIVRQVDVMEFRAVVVTDEAGHLLKMLGLEFNDRGGADAMGLLAARDEGLLERGAKRLAAEETQKTGPRGDTENFLGPWRAQPLEIDRQFG